MSDKLKPCPFCGYNPGAVGTFFYDYPKKYYHARCLGFDCSIKPSTINYPTEEEAITAWNRRSDER